MQNDFGNGRPTCKSRKSYVKSEENKNNLKKTRGTTTIEQATRPSVPRAFKRDFTEITCYDSQLTEHTSRDCKQLQRPLKCYKCRADGHTAKY